MDRLFRFAAILVIAFSSFASSCGGGPTAPSPIPVVNPPTAPRLDLSPLSPKAREIFIVNNLGLETGFVKKWTGVITIGGTAEIQPYLPGALKFWEDKKIAGISFQLGTSGAVNVTVQEFQGEACAAVLSRNVVFDTGVITGADVRFRPECFFRIRDGPNGRYFIELILAHEIGHCLLYTSPSPRD